MVKIFLGCPNRRREDSFQRKFRGRRQWAAVIPKELNEHEIILNFDAYV